MLNRLKDFLHAQKLKKYSNTNLGSIPANQFANISSIGLLFNAENDRDTDQVAKYSRMLKKGGKDVSVLGYFENIKDPGPQKFSYFTATSLNIARVSTSDVAKQFAAANFDVLISFDYHNLSAVTYVAAASQAYFKIGPANGNAQHFDLMIDLDGNYRIDHMISEIHRTFNLLNQK